LQQGLTSVHFISLRPALPSGVWQKQQKTL